MIYAYISTFTVGFTYLRMFVDLDIASPKHVSRMKIFETLWIKEGIKKGQKTPKTGIPWPVPQSRCIEEKP